MKNYTTEEIKKLIQEARALGVVLLKVDGFEVSFPQPTAQAPAPAEAKVEEPQERLAREFCRECGGEKVLGKHGNFYCKPCWKARNL